MGGDEGVAGEDVAIAVVVDVVGTASRFVGVMDKLLDFP